MSLCAVYGHDPAQSVFPAILRTILTSFNITAILPRDGGINCERHGLFAYYFVNRTALAALRSRILEPLDQLA